MTALQMTFLIGGSFGVMAAAWEMAKSARNLSKSADLLADAAVSVGLSSQRLIGEAALLNVDALRRDVGSNYEFLEGDGN